MAAETKGTKTTETTEEASGAAKAAEEPQGKRTIATYKNGGLNVRRVLSAADWKAMGVEGQRQLVWERANRWMVDVTEAHPIVKKYLQDDSSFTVEEL